jgi:hypothetical protein
MCRTRIIPHGSGRKRLKKQADLPPTADGHGEKVGPPDFSATRTTKSIAAIFRYSLPPRKQPEDCFVGSGAQIHSADASSQ